MISDLDIISFTLRLKATLMSLINTERLHMAAALTLTHVGWGTIQ